MSFATPVLPCCRAAARRASSSRRALATAAAPSASSSSTSSSTPPKSYKRPIKPGVSSVYDSAVAFIEQDRQEKLAQLQELRKRVSSSSGTSSGSTELHGQILGLEIASEINDPETRWRFQQGLADMSKPVYRYLSEQAWRKDGRLGLLMQRVTQMNIVPDLVGSIDPDVDLQVIVEDGEVVPGVFLKPEQTLSPPTLHVQVYHPEERLYTLLMVDPDSPNPASDSFKTVCHWALCNIPLDATRTSISADDSSITTLQSYIPPHPQKGTPYHRYTFLLYEQQSGRIDNPSLPSDAEEGLNTRAFASQYSLVPRGVHFYRQVWNDSVSQIYQDILKVPEPTFGRPKKIDRYKRVDA